jgi:hypothetical protein
VLTCGAILGRARRRVVVHLVCELGRAEDEEFQGANTRKMLGIHRAAEAARVPLKLVWGEEVVPGCDATTL